MRKLLRKLRRAMLNHDPSFCDMYEDADSRTAAQEYLERIRRHLRERFGDQRLSILDAGCQAGRLLIPLAQDGHRLIGIDTSEFALRRTRRHVKELGLAVHLHRGTIAHVRRWVRCESLDVVICAEVLYLCEDYRELLRLLADSVKPGGLLCISHRPSQYYVAVALSNGRPEQARSVLEHTEGPSPDGTYHNWQTEPQLRELYHGMGLRILACDPLDHVEVETNGVSIPPEIARALEAFRQSASTWRVPSYLLAIAQKS